LLVVLSAQLGDGLCMSSLSDSPNLPFTSHGSVCLELHNGFKFCVGHFRSYVYGGSTVQCLIWQLKSCVWR